MFLVRAMVCPNFALSLFRGTWRDGMIVNQNQGCKIGVLEAKISYMTGGIISPSIPRAPPPRRDGVAQ